jgi:hypothetical protein
MARRLIAAMVMLLALMGVAMMPAAALTKKQACDLVSEDDVEAAFGAAPTTTTPDGEEGVYTTCTWILPAEGGSTNTVFVGIDKPSKIAKEDFKERRKAPDAEKVKGIKKGFVIAESNAGTVTFIRSGNFVNVQFLGSAAEDVEANTEGLIDLAKGLYDEL